MIQFRRDSVRWIGAREEYLVTGYNLDDVLTFAIERIKQLAAAEIIEQLVSA
jgi:hypothetical protein